MRTTSSLASHPPPPPFYVIMVNGKCTQVESLSAARQSVSANEPLDSIRVVNALLTQLDAIKRSVCVLSNTYTVDNNKLGGHYILASPTPNSGGTCLPVLPRFTPLLTDRMQAVGVDSCGVNEWQTT